MTEETLFAALEKHCSQCAHFWSHPETAQMYNNRFFILRNVSATTRKFFLVV